MSNEEELDLMLSEAYERGYAKAQEEIDRLKQWNKFYYSLLCNYTNALDEWIATKGDPKRNLPALDRCKKLEKILRRERDRFAGKLEIIDPLQPVINFIN